MITYSSLHSFTIVPLTFNNPSNQFRVMEELFGVEEGERVYSTNVECYDVKVLYKLKLGEENIIPSVVKYLNNLYKLKEYNRLIVEYNIEKGKTIIVLGEGEKLLLANSYNTVDFGSAIYYILEVLRENQINPHQTLVNLYAAPTIDELNLIERYLKGVKVCAL